MVDIRKPVRNGLKNVERIKAKQMKKGGKWYYIFILKNML